MLKLKIALENHINSLVNFANLQRVAGDFSFAFIDFFDNEMSKNDPQNYIPETTFQISLEINPEKIERFNFEKLQSECNIITPIAEKIQNIEDRLLQFRQWQIQYDELVFDKDIGSYHPLTEKFFSNFEDLCGLELERLRKRLVFEDTRTQQCTTIMHEVEMKGNYTWNSSDTDLLELLAALHKSESIKRKDGKVLTRKELIDYFQTILGIEIKDVEGKLARATNRNANTPFLENLAQEFRNYASEKLAKQSKRK
jgi:hypothetical protein